MSDETITFLSAAAELDVSAKPEAGLPLVAPFGVAAVLLVPLIWSF